MRAAIVLAAGSSRRFGRQDKLLARVGGRPLLLHALANALDAPVQRLLVVVPSRGGRVARLARRGGGRRVQLVVAADHARGLGASLARGLAALRPVDREVLIFLGDMPHARAWPRLRLPPGHDAARPVVGRIPSHPLLVRTRVARERQSAAGDAGLASRLDPARLHRVPVGGRQAEDVDTRRALRRMRTGRAKRR